MEQCLPVPLGLGSDERIVGVVVSPHRRLLRREQLVGVREDPVPAVHPVDLVAVGDVEVGRLLGDVAVPGCHRPPQCHERRVVERAHVGRDVGLRVAVRPQDELPVGVERDVGPDLLDAVHHAPVDEVAQGPRLGRGERGRAAVRARAPLARRPAAAAPAVSVVAVEVRVHGVPGGVALQVLAPGPVGRAGEVVAHAVRVEGEDDEHLARVHEACHGLVRPVVARQPAAGARAPARSSGAPVRGAGRRPGPRAPPRPPRRCR